MQVRIPCRAGHEAQHAEFGRLLYALWRVPQPIEFTGRHYEVHRQWSPLRPQPLPTVIAHAGDAAFDAGLSAFADVCVLPAGPPAEVAARVARLRELADDVPLRFGIAVRPVVGDDAMSAAGLARRLLACGPDLLCRRRTRLAPQHRAAAAGRTDRGVWRGGAPRR